MVKLDKKKKGLFYRIIYKIVKAFYKTYTIEGKENIISSGSVFISNHAQIHGPLAQQIYFPNPKRIWVISEMCSRQEAAAYAMKDFWPNKSKFVRWFYQLFSKLIVSWLGPYLMKNANTIPVYKDMRLSKTIKMTIETLHQEQNVIIFPEHDVKLNKYINDFQSRFVDIAYHYYKKHQQLLSFYPVYVSASSKKIIIGKAITYDHTQNINDERKRIINYLQHEMTEIAENLKEKKIIPYRN